VHAQRGGQRLVRRLGVVALACASVVLASCGGGDRKSYFTPDSIVSFGDENSAIASDTSSNLLDSTFPGAATDLSGLTYTAKAVVTTSAVVCAYDSSQAKACSSDNGVTFTSAGTTYRVPTGLNWVIKFEVDAGPTNQRTTVVDYACDATSTWVQIVARAYGKGYTSQCAQDTRGGAVSYAALGAKTADVIVQINAHRSELNSKTVVTIMVGQNDILEQYQAIQGSTQTEAGAIAELQARASNMASVVKDVIGTGAKVVLALTPDLGQTPLAVGAGTTTLMTNLVRAYNDRLYITGLGNVSGRSLAGINPESLTKPSTRSSSYQYVTPLCDAAAVLRPDGGAPADDDEKLLFCTSQYYTSGTAASTAIWADAKRAAPLLHNLIGATVFNRAYEQF
jgi:GDSL-like Lipase/Acylhydrolase